MSIYTKEWSERMHSALQTADVSATELRKMKRIAGAMFSAANDIVSVTALRTVVIALANEMLAELKYADDIKEAAEYGLQLPEAEQEQTEEELFPEE